MERSGEVSTLSAGDTPARPFSESLCAENSLPGCCQNADQSPHAIAWNVERRVGLCFLSLRIRHLFK